MLSTVSAEPIATFPRSGEEVADALEVPIDAASTTVIVAVESPVPVDSTTTTLDPAVDPNAATTTVTTIAAPPPAQPVDSVDIPLPPIDSVDIPTTFPPDEPAEPVIPYPGGTDPATMRVVIANADSAARPDLENSVLATLNGLGYGVVTMADDLAPIDGTIVYFRDGFNRAAFTIALDLEAADVSLLPMPEGLAAPLTSADDAGDVIVLLGPDVPA